MYNSLLKIVFFLAVILSRNIFALPLVGQDYLGAQNRNFNIQNAIRSVERGTPIGVLDGTFGTDLTPIRSLLGGVVPAYLRVHFINNTCVRNHNCGKYEPVYGLTLQGLEAKIRAKDPKILGYLKDRVRLYLSLSALYPQTTFLVSPILEHNLSSTAWRILADTVLSVWPNVQLVNSPEGVGSSETYKGAWVERHGKDPRSPYSLVSTDGTDSTDIDISAFKNNTKRAKIAFNWTRSFNCRHQGAWEDPRVRKSCPTQGTFDMLAHLTDDRGPAPRIAAGICRSISRLTSPGTLKPLSEDKGKNDPRANRPVTITGLGKGTTSIIGRNGKTIGTLGYYAPYDTHTNRHYSGWRGGTGEEAYTLEKKAIKLSGSSWVWLRQGGKCLGPIVPGMRQGSYR